jgi:3-oxoacyl-[acyl-carrier protein] reductase
MPRLAGKSAIVTGAASGIGEATALLFAKEGAAVLVADMNAAGVESVVQAITAEGGRAAGFVIDVSDKQQIANCVKAAVDTFGSLDILVNNAGMSSAQGMDPNIDVWEKGIQTTLSSVYWMSKAAIEFMKERGGNIVNISSLAGNLQGTPVEWYCGAKAGVAGVTRSFATTYGPMGIRTNAVCPGAVDTPRVRVILDKLPGQEDIHNKRNPLRRMAKAAEIASIALFLASEDSSYVNGQAIVADGGYTLQV